MGNLRFEIDCTENGPTGSNMTGKPLSSLKPYLYRIEIKGPNDNISIDADEPIDANFRVIQMTDVRLVPEKHESGENKQSIQAGSSEGDMTIFFKAIIEFNLDFEPDSDYGGEFFKSVLEETNWSVEISSSTMGLQTGDGKMDNNSFDGVWDSVLITLKNVKT